MKRGRIFFPFLMVICFCLVPPLGSQGFGFVAHRKINRLAVYTLPPEMVGFFKKHIEYLSEHGVDPDRRAYAIEGEAGRHYIDLERFGESPFDSLPRRWTTAVEKYSEDTLLSRGILPWHIYLMMIRLTNAFSEHRGDLVLYHSANIGHYIADACTPLHTTRYYDGKKPDHKGLHALWESRLPEMLAEEFDYLVGRAEYLEDPLGKAWELVALSHSMVDSIFHAYDLELENHPSDRIFTFEVRGQALSRVYCRDFVREINQRLDQMVERQMRLAIKSVGDFWYTAWVNAGQPDLHSLEQRGTDRKLKQLFEQEKKEWEKVEEPAGRPNPE